MFEEAEAIKDSLLLGIHAELDNPKLKDVVGYLTEEQVDWISSWLAGEGFIRYTASDN